MHRTSKESLCAWRAMEALEVATRFWQGDFLPAKGLESSRYLMNPIRWHWIWMAKTNPVSSFDTAVVLVELESSGFCWGLEGTPNTKQWLCTPNSIFWEEFIGFLFHASISATNAYCSTAKNFSYNVQAGDFFFLKDKLGPSSSSSPMQRQCVKFAMSMCLASLKVQLFGSCHLGSSRVDRLTNLGRGTVFSRAQMLLLSSGLGTQESCDEEPQKSRHENYMKHHQTYRMESKMLPTLERKWCSPQLRTEAVDPPKLYWTGSLESCLCWVASQHGRENSLQICLRRLGCFVCSCCCSHVLLAELSPKLDASWQPRHESCALDCGKVWLECCNLSASRFSTSFWKGGRRWSWSGSIINPKPVRQGKEATGQDNR